MRSGENLIWFVFMDYGSLQTPTSQIHLPVICVKEKVLKY